MTQTDGKLPTSRDGGIDQGLDHVRKALDGLTFGSVLLTVHEGRLVQVDVTEKRRLSPQSN